MKKLDIIYEDKEILVVNKPAKLLTISDGKTENTLYSMAREYVKKKHKSNKIFIVHRLDKDTSGIILFAKNEGLKKYLQDNWNTITKRKYIALLSGDVKTSEGVIKNYLAEDKTHRVYVTNKESGEYAETKYSVLNKMFKCTLVDIEIKTGKKHQIRVGFSNFGHPIVGDKKYGSKINPYRRVMLHASGLEVNIKGNKNVFSCKIPKEFVKYMKID